MPIFQPSAGPVPFTTLDVFTTKRYAGNPLAVVDTSESPSLNTEQRHEIAKEFNLSETVFVSGLLEGEEGLVWDINIHTVARELPFAGHPTIGAACYLVSKYLQGRKPEEGVEATLITPAGPIDVVYFAQEYMATAKIPHNYHQHAADVSGELLRSLQPKLKLPPKRSNIVSIVKGMTFVLVQLADLPELGRVRPHAIHPELVLDEGWATAGHVGVYYYVCLPDSTDGSKRIRTRMMDFGITSEDPATGSAACTLTAFLTKRYAKPGVKVRFMLTQGVEMGRTSDIGVEVELAEDGELKEVKLAGSVTNVMRGELIAPISVS